MGKGIGIFQIFCLIENNLFLAHGSQRRKKERERNKERRKKKWEMLFFIYILVERNVTGKCSLNLWFKSEIDSH